MVDNELPVSTLNSPVEEEISTENYDDDDNLETLSNSNNRSGSYSNLFREKTEQQNNFYLITENKSATAAKEENLYSNIPQNIINAELSTSHDIEHNFNNSHVYSNVSAAASTTIGQADLSLKHSDLTDVITTQPKTTTIPSTQKNVSLKNHRIELLPDDIDPNRLLNDDLDLDEPVIVASIFGKPNTTKHKPQTNNSSSSNNSGGSNSKYLKSKCDHMTSVESLLSSTINNTTSANNHNASELIMSTNRFGINNESMASIDKIPSTIENNLSDDVVGSSTSSSSLSFMNKTATTTNTYSSPRRMRLIHDTTMIDTALDLDSLDGSSIGNYSQGCLVKTTANV